MFPATPFATAAVRIRFYRNTCRILPFPYAQTVRSGAATQARA